MLSGFSSVLPNSNSADMTLANSKKKTANKTIETKEKNNMQQKIRKRRKIRKEKKEEKEEK